MIWNLDNETTRKKTRRTVTRTGWRSTIGCHRKLNCNSRANNSFWWLSNILRNDEDGCDGKQFSNRACDDDHPQGVRDWCMLFFQLSVAREWFDLSACRADRQTDRWWRWWWYLQVAQKGLKFFLVIYTMDDSDWCVIAQICNV